MLSGAQILKRLQGLQSERALLDDTLQQVSEYALPDRGGFNQTITPGDRRRRKIMDSTAEKSIEMSASFLHTNLTSSATPWFKLAVQTGNYDANHAVNVYLEEVTSRMYSRVFNNATFGFHASTIQAFIDLIAYGNVVLYLDDIPGSGLFFKTIPLSQVWFGQAHGSQPRMIIRKYELTAGEAIAEFDDPGMHIRKVAEKNPDQNVELVQAVYPRDTKTSDPVLLLRAENKQWASVHVCCKSKEVIRESGYDRNPFVTVRMFRGVGETYGRSPAMIALADIKTLNAVMRATVRGLQKIVDPPVLVPNDGFLSRGGLNPGDIAYYDASVGDPSVRIRPMVSQSRPDFGVEFMSEIRNRMRDVFYVNQMMFISDARMSATEVRERVQQNMQMMAPLTTLLQEQMLEPIVERVYDHMDRTGQLDDIEVPQELRGRTIEVNYVSPLASAQKASTSDSFMMLMQRTVALFENDPELFQMFDTDGVIRDIARNSGMPTNYLRDPQTVAMIKQAANEAAQEQQAMQAVQMAGQAAPGLAQAAQMMGDQGGG